MYPAMEASNPSFKNKFQKSGKIAYLLLEEALSDFVHPYFFDNNFMSFG